MGPGGAHRRFYVTLCVYVCVTALQNIGSFVDREKKVNCRTHCHTIIM